MVKKPKATKNIDHGHLNSASFGQRLPGSKSFMTHKEVTNKLFWTYNNINKSRCWLWSFKQLVQIHRLSARIQLQVLLPMKESWKAAHLMHFKNATRQNQTPKTNQIKNLLSMSGQRQAPRGPPVTLPQNPPPASSNV